MDGETTAKKKWGNEAISSGFTMLPNHLLALNQFVKEADKQLTPTEMLVVLQILVSWWSSDKYPFPSKTTIAERAGLSSRQVQRALSTLDSKGYITRVTRYSSNNARTSNQFDLSGLVKVVAEVASANPTAFKRKSVTSTE